MKKRTVGFALCIMIFFSSLTAFAQQQKDVEKKEKQPTKVERTDIKADSVQIAYMNYTKILGQMEFKLGEEMLPGAPEPSGPVKVMIFREIASENLAAAKELGVKVSGAYIQKEPTKYVYICDVDLKLSDEELAKQFGVETKGGEENKK